MARKLKKKNAPRKRAAVKKKRAVKRPAKRKASVKRKAPAAKLNPANFKQVKQSTGWMPASAVRIVKRGGKVHVLVRRKKGR